MNGFVSSGSLDLLEAVAREIGTAASAHHRPDRVRSFRGRDQRRLDAVVEEVEQFRTVELLGGRQLAERRQHFSRSRHRHSKPVSPVSPVQPGNTRIARTRMSPHPPGSPAGRRIVRRTETGTRARLDSASGMGSEVASRG